MAGSFFTALAAKHQDAPPDEPKLDVKMIVGTLGLVLFALIYYIDERLSGLGTTDLTGGFQEGQDEGSWLTTTYALGQIMVIPMTPWLASVFSLRAIAVVLICLSTVSSALLMGTADYHTIMVLRLLQGFGEGGSVPLMLGRILRDLPKYRRPEALTIYGLVVTVPVLATFSLAGVASDLSSWRGLFAAAPLLGPVAVVLVVAGLPGKKPDWSAFRNADYFGLFSITASAAALVVGCSQGQRLDWFDSGFIDAMFVLFAWFLVCFLANTILVKKPLYRLATFKKVNFSVGLVEIALFAVSLLGVGTLYPQEQALIRSLRPIQMGNTTMVLLIPLVTIAGMLPYLLRRVDARLILACGLFLVSLGAWLCVWVSPSWSGLDYRLGLLLQVTGWLMVIVTNALLTTGVLGPPDMLTGSAMFNLMRTIGFAVGGAVLTGILTVRERVHGNANIVRNLTPGREPVRRVIASHGPDALSSLQTSQASVMAFADSWGWLAIIVCFALFLSLLLTPAKVMRPPS